MGKNEAAASDRRPRGLFYWLRSFFQRLISPPRSVLVSDEYLAQSSYAVLIILYYCSLIFIGILFILLMVSLLLLHNTYVSGRIVVGGVLFGYVAIGLWRLKAGSERLAAAMLLVLYAFIGTLAVVWWSISVPFGLLMFAFVITLAGITLGPRFTLPVSLGVIVILLASQMLAEAGLIHPDRSRLMVQPGIADVANFGLALLIIGLVSWLSGRKLKGSLDRALTAEKALENEKNSLAIKLAERTKKLQAAQLTEMQQLYRFAELGQLSTALLHDLANHLTALTLDIEDIDKKRHSQAISRAKKSIFYLDKMVEQVRGQLQEGTHSRTFNVKHIIEAVIEQLASRARKYHVDIELSMSQRASDARITGDSTRFRQVMTILISNAIEAYARVPTDDSERRVLIDVHYKNRTLHIVVRDWGEGIEKSIRSKIFKPFNSTKQDGMGIGLFIAKQMMETHFKGSIELADEAPYTEFQVKLKAK